MLRKHKFNFNCSGTLAALLILIGVIIIMCSRIPLRYASSDSLISSLVGILIGGCLILLGIGIISISNHSLDKKYTQGLEAFKITANKILVDLDKCTIKSGSRIEEIPKSYNERRYDGIDTWITGIKRDETKEIVQSVLTYEINIYGKTETFHVLIEKDEITLRFLLEEQKTTYLYLDKTNKDNYYFDFEFLGCPVYVYKKRE